MASDETYLFGKNLLIELFLYLLAVLMFLLIQRLERRRGVLFSLLKINHLKTKKN
jgi:hypothetical protein